MCSNCSSDDLKPESFAAFDVSSPKGRHDFAGHADRKRKRYRTARILATLTETPLIRAILHIRRRAEETGITGKFDRPSFVNLNSRAFERKRAAETSVAPQSREIIEIRVSPDAIIEVFATAEAAESVRDDFGVSEGRDRSAWTESFAARRELERALKGLRRARQFKYFVAYGALLICAAMVVWYALG